jgi:uncharacterized membrane protein YhaH (DUF805 family)
MSIGQSVSTVLKNYAVFRGRASRPEFWWYYLVYAIVAIIIGIIDGAIGANNILVAIYVLALFLPTLAVIFRRLHDSDKRGWWVLIQLIPIVGTIVLLVFLVSKGTPGDNRFGPPTA